ncbi:MAG: hypothetical protein JW819_09930 [Candidatus Krumholzibacteriota bacterium]|nr:hypothetical protein [Candidatus Krumholzibacteriota bacterium]
MTSRKVLSVMAALALLAIAAIANAGIISPADSYATMANSPGVMTIAPGGYDSFVFPVDHTIDVYTLDDLLNPVEVLATDIWLDDPLVIWCAGGVIADSSTFAPDPGHTTFTGTPRGGVNVSGDCSTIAIDVIALGNVIQTLNLGMNSMDLNGSGDVTVADFGAFAGVYQTDNECANYDESTTSPTVDIADFAIFAGVYNISECP